MISAPSPVAPGGALAYTLRFGNPGGASSPAAILEVSLPLGTSFVSATDGATVAGGLVQWNVGVLAPGAVGQRQLVVAVDPQAISGSLVTALADLRDAATSRSLARANGAAAVLSSIGTQVAMTAAPDPVRPGELVQYAVTVTNRSIGDLSYSVQAQVPNHTTVDSGNIGQSGGCGLLVCTAGRPISWNRVISAEQAMTFSFAARVDTTNAAPNGTVIRSTVTATSGNNGATTAVDVVISTADLSLGMISAPSPVAPGGALAYTLRFGNPGGASSPAAILEVPLPLGTSFVSATDGATVAGGLVQWNVGVLAPGAVGQRQLVVAVDPQAISGSLVTALADLRDAATSRSLARANGAAAVLSSIGTQVAMTAAPDPVRPGELVQYAVTVTNRSIGDLSYSVQAQVPNHTTVDSGNIGQSGGCGLLVCTAGRPISWNRVISAEQAMTFSFAARVDTTNAAPNGTVIRSTVTATGGNNGA